MDSRWALASGLTTLCFQSTSRTMGRSLKHPYSEARFFARARRCDIFLSSSIVKKESRVDSGALAPCLLTSRSEDGSQRRSERSERSSSSVARPLTAAAAKATARVGTRSAPWLTDSSRCSLASWKAHSFIKVDGPRGHAISVARCT